MPRTLPPIRPGSTRPDASAASTSQDCTRRRRSPAAIGCTPPRRPARGCARPRWADWARGDRSAWLFPRRDRRFLPALPHYPAAPEEMLKDAEMPIDDQKARSVGNWSELVARMQQDTGLHNSGISTRIPQRIGLIPDRRHHLITTLYPRGQCIGITANSFDSVSMDPPRSGPASCGWDSMRILPLHRPFRGQCPEPGAGRTLHPLRHASADKWAAIDFELWDSGCPILALAAPPTSTAGPSTLMTAATM